MMRRHRPDRSLTLDRARRRFEHWRKTRPHGTPIPEALWTLAVEAAREHGLNPTARYLHLGYNDLKRHLKMSSSAATRTSRDSEILSDGSTRRRQPSARFIELAPPPLASAALTSAPCTIEVENGQGMKMKIHLANPEAVDLVGLIGGLGDRKR